jgi:hypothetical protein
MPAHRKHVTPPSDLRYQSQVTWSHDIQAAIDAIPSGLQRGDLTDGLIFDVVRH